MKIFDLTSLYDLLVFLTCNYSQMPNDFKSRFSETFCVTMRQSLFNCLSSEINWTNFVLTVIKYAATLLIGYFGGNAVV